MPEVKIARCYKQGGAVRVDFETDTDPDFYYVHSLHSEGYETDHGVHSTMWAWVNHLRDKMWWNQQLEDDFIIRVRNVL